MEYITSNNTNIITETLNSTLNVTKEHNNWTYRNGDVNVDFPKNIMIGWLVSYVITILTNILVVVTVCASIKFWRYSMDILMLTLALVDILGSAVRFILYFPRVLHVSYLLLLWHSRLFYITFYYVNLSLDSLSKLMMMAISVNRYALVCKPFTHHSITSKKSTVTQIIILAGIAFTANSYSLVTENMTQSAYKTSTIIVNMVMLSFVPLIITFILTVLVIREFKKTQRTLRDSVSSGADFRGEKNITRAMITVNVVFILLVLPHFIAFVFDSSNIFVDLFSLPYVVNFFINIFIYICYIPKFRSTLFGIFKCKWCKRVRDESFHMSAV